MTVQAGLCRSKSETQIVVFLFAKARFKLSNDLTDGYNFVCLICGFALGQSMAMLGRCLDFKGLLPNIRMT